MVVLVQLVVALPVILDAIPLMAGDALAVVEVLRWMVGDDSAAVVALVAPPEVVGDDSAAVVALVAPPEALAGRHAVLHVCLPLAFSRMELDGRQPSLPHRPSA